MNIDLQGNVLIRHQSIPDCQKCEETKKILDDCVYGLEDAKMQILQYIGQWISNPNTT